MMFMYLKEPDPKKSNLQALNFEKSDKEKN